MKKRIDFTIPALAIPLFIAIFFNLHGCNTKQEIKQRDYQIEVTQDSIYLYDKDKLVGTMKLEYDKDPLGTMILEDNQ